MAPDSQGLAPHSVLLFVKEVFACLIFCVFCFWKYLGNTVPKNSKTCGLVYAMKIEMHMSIFKSSL